MNNKLSACQSYRICFRGQRLVNVPDISVVKYVILGRGPTIHCCSPTIWPWKREVTLALATFPKASLPWQWWSHLETEDIDQGKIAVHYLVFLVDKLICEHMWISVFFRHPWEYSVTFILIKGLCSCKWQKRNSNELSQEGIYWLMKLGSPEIITGSGIVWSRGSNDIVSFLSFPVL